MHQCNRTKQLHHHIYRNKILPTMFSNSFYSIDIVVFRFHLILFLWVQLTIGFDWFRQWLGTKEVAKHQWWLNLQIYLSVTQHSSRFPNMPRQRQWTEPEVGVYHQTQFTCRMVCKYTPGDIYIYMYIYIYHIYNKFCNLSLKWEYQVAWQLSVVVKYQYQYIPSKLFEISNDNCTGLPIRTFCEDSECCLSAVNIMPSGL